MSNERGSGCSCLFLILLVVGVYFFFFKEDTWLGFYYPDKSDMSRHIKSSELKSLEECRSWVNVQFRKYSESEPESEYDYECGRDCELETSGLYMCEETLR